MGAGMPQVLLEHPETVPRIIVFYRHNGEGGPQTVRADIVHSTGFRVYQFWQSGFLGTLFHYLPGPVAVNAEDEPFPVPLHRPTTLDIFFEHGESLAINGQHSLASMLLFFK